MKKIMFLMIFMFVLVGVAHAEIVGPTIEDLLTQSGSTSITIEASDVVYTSSFSLRHCEDVGIALDVSENDTVSIGVRLEQSYQRPTTEGIADSEWVQPEGLGNILTLSGTTLVLEEITYEAFPYGRLRFTSDGSNSAGTVIRARLSKRTYV